MQRCRHARNRAGAAPPTHAMYAPPPPLSTERPSRPDPPVTLSAPAPLVVAIPARDEAERLPACLLALSRQVPFVPHEVLVLLNNTSDDSAAVLRALVPTLAMPVHVVEARLPPAMSHAGTARSLALRRAAALAGPDGVLLTTDADGRVAPDWLHANRMALEAGADLVCGRAVIDPVEARLIPAALHEDDAAEVAYATLLDELHATLDPDPADPWPRHTEHSGASLAVRLPAYRRAGGMPAVALGEDRAFVDALRRVDARIRHAPEAWVTVSGRLQGRAAGGMADTMRRRVTAQDPLLDDRLEPAACCARRARARHALRRAWTDPLHPDACARAAAVLDLPVAVLAELLQAPHFGAAWSEAESRSPALVRHPVARADLPREAEAARRLLRARPLTPPACPADTPAHAAAAPP